MSVWTLQAVLVGFLAVAYRLASLRARGDGAGT